MREGLYRPDPLTPEERDEHERDLILFSDRELDGLGDVSGLEVLYAGGASPLWLEGLSTRIGPRGSLTALEIDAEAIDGARAALRGADLPAPVTLVTGDVFRPPLPPGSFDLVYSAGLVHELDAGRGGLEAALAALVPLLRPGGRLAASDFVTTEGAADAVQVEDERLDAERAYREEGRRPLGIGPPGPLVRAFEGHLRGVRWGLSPPFPIRHLDRLVTASWGEDRAVLRRRILAEGYTRPATIYVEGWRPSARGRA